MDVTKILDSDTLVLGTSLVHRSMEFLLDYTSQALSPLLKRYSGHRTLSGTRQFLC
jgi:hypothetical protein